MNRIKVIGHLGKDPETRYTSDGRKVVHFTIACNVYRNGQQTTQWFSVSCWDEKHEKITQHLSKGKLCYVYGELTVRKWTDNAGVEQTSLEINAKDISFVPGRSDNKSDQGTQSISASTINQNTTQVDPFQNQDSNYAGFGQAVAVEAQHTTDDIPF